MNSIGMSINFDSCCIVTGFLYIQSKFVQRLLVSTVHNSTRLCTKKSLDYS